MVFLDRADAGRQLAAALALYRDRDAVVLALPRGGVPVAVEIAAALGAPLDIVLVRKIGAPDHRELAMGAIVDGIEPIVIRNEDIIRLLRVGDDEFDAACARELAEIERRRRRFAASVEPVDVAGRTAIVVDDGAATGATARAALRATRNRRAVKIVLAVPVAAPQAIEALRREADEAVCLQTPADFESVGAFYRDFRQLRDEDVIAILARSLAAR